MAGISTNHDARSYSGPVFAYYQKTAIHLQPLQNMKNIIAVWGVGGCVLLLSWAIFRLTPITLEAFSFDLHWHHWTALMLNLLFMAYYEGYRGFQKAYSPRIAARSKYVRDTGSLIEKILAPIFCMGYFHAAKRRLIATYGLTLGIIALLVVFQQIPQPWRGIFDAGVLFGLSWGVVSIIAYAYIALTAPSFEYSPELS